MLTGNIVRDAEDDNKDVYTGDTCGHVSWVLCLFSRITHVITLILPDHGPLVTTGTNTLITGPETRPAIMFTMATMVLGGSDLLCQMDLY